MTSGLSRRRVLASVGAAWLGAGFASCARAPDTDATAANGARVQTGVLWDPSQGLNADLYFPAVGASSGAGVLMLHGGGWAAGSREDMAWFGRLLSGLGMVAVSADYRLIDGVNVFAEDQLADARAALGALVSNAPTLGIDTSRLGVLGTSAGGHLAAMLATDQDTPVRAAALLWSPTDLTISLSEVTPAGAQILRRYLAAAQSSGAALSPLLRVDSSEACRDWLLIHCDRDELIPVSQSRSMHARLLAAGVRSRYLELPGQAHFPTSPAAQRRARQALIEFFSVLRQ